MTPAASWSEPESVSRRWSLPQGTPFSLSWRQKHGLAACPVTQKRLWNATGSPGIYFETRVPAKKQSKAKKKPPIWVVVPVKKYISPAPDRRTRLTLRTVCESSLLRGRRVRVWPFALRAYNRAVKEPPGKSRGEEYLWRKLALNLRAGLGPVQGEKGLPPSLIFVGSAGWLVRAGQKFAPGGPGSGNLFKNALLLTPPTGLIREWETEDKPQTTPEAGAAKPGEQTKIQFSLARGGFGQTEIRTLPGGHRYYQGVDPGRGVFLLRPRDPALREFLAAFFQKAVSGP